MHVYDCEPFHHNSVDEFAIQFPEIFSKKEQKSREVSVKRAKISDSMVRTSNSIVGEADLCSSPDSSSSSKASGFQKIVPVDGGVSLCYGFYLHLPFPFPFPFPPSVA